MFAVKRPFAGPRKTKLDVPADLRLPLRRISFPAAVILFLLACITFAQSPNAILPGPKPPDAPEQWKTWIGDYGFKEVNFIVGELEGRVLIIDNDGKRWDLPSLPIDESVVAERTSTTHVVVRFLREPSGTQALLTNDLGWSKRTYGVDDQHVARMKPVHPIDELRPVALAAKPPEEPGPFRKPDLVELAPLDSSIHLDIRYATANDFLAAPVYSQARAFLQRSAAEALLLVQKKLKPLGYGLLIHDAYRPWYVTKIFWDATPPEGKIFVADPAQGSRHNRGCAVDLTLYDLATGKPIEMPGTYDEMSPRSFRDYPGGTSLQRWHRDLLRRAMESEGYTVYESEWWHFDYKAWKEYPILNVPFEKLGSSPGTMSVH
jgi:D-alanyl-D-alanine dipeptidase